MKYKRLFGFIAIFLIIVGLLVYPLIMDELAVTSEVDEESESKDDVTVGITESGTDEKYQHDADIVRLQHLYEIVNYIEDYKLRVGQYPLASDTEQEYTLIATDEQLKYAPEDGPVYEDMSELERLLKEEVSEEIKLPVDPQKVPVNKPNFYIYMTQNNDYIIAVHLHNEYSFSKNIAPHYNKVEVSSNPNSTYKIWSPDELFDNDDFIEAINKEMYKKEYFDSLNQ